MHDHTSTNLTLLDGGLLDPASFGWAGPLRDTIVHVVGARPNFVKMAPVITALEKRGAQVRWVIEQHRLGHRAQRGQVSIPDSFERYLARLRKTALKAGQG